MSPIHLRIPAIFAIVNPVVILLPVRNKKHSVILFLESFSDLIFLSFSYYSLIYLFIKRIL